MSVQNETRLQPPYVAYQSAKTAIAQFKEHLVPDRIDRSVLRNFSGTVGTQILTAFRFLGLADPAGYSTDRMRTLVDAYGTDMWPTVLGDVLQAAYAPLFELNLETCSPSQFAEKFRASYHGAEDVTRKSVSFFLNAASDAQIQISSFIKKGRKTHGVTKRRPKISPSARREVPSETAPTEATPPSGAKPSAFLDKLMEKFPPLDPEWSDEVKAKWFDAFGQLMAKANEKGPA